MDNCDWRWIIGAAILGMVVVGPGVERATGQADGGAGTLGELLRGAMPSGGGTAGTNPPAGPGGTEQPGSQGSGATGPEQGLEREGKKGEEGKEGMGTTAESNVEQNENGNIAELPVESLVGVGSAGRESDAATVPPANETVPRAWVYEGTPLPVVLNDVAGARGWSLPWVRVDPRIRVQMNTTKSPAELWEELKQTYDLVEEREGDRRIISERRLVLERDRMRSGQQVPNPDTITEQTAIQIGRSMVSHQASGPVASEERRVIAAPAASLQEREQEPETVKASTGTAVATRSQPQPSREGSVMPTRVPGPTSQPRATSPSSPSPVPPAPSSAARVAATRSVSGPASPSTGGTGSTGVGNRSGQGQVARAGRLGETVPPATANVSQRTVEPPPRPVIVPVATAEVGTHPKEAQDRKRWQTAMQRAERGLLRDRTGF